MDIKNSILADAISTLTELGKKAAEPKELVVSGRHYLVTGSDYEEIVPERVPNPEKVITYSLDALVALLKNEAKSYYKNFPLYVSCETHKTVRVFTKPDADDDLQRWTAIEARASDLPPVVEDVHWSFEEAQIKLRTLFQRAPEGKANGVDYILGLLSHMSMDQSIKSDDNGVTQTVQVKKGVSFVENQRVNPIVKLAPYRTFQEVQQPESEFVFRIYEDRSISLTAADGCMWKMDARAIVHDHLVTALSDEIQEGLVVVTL